jgi:hypothetical protein
MTDIKSIIKLYRMTDIFRKAAVKLVYVHTTILAASGLNLAIPLALELVSFLIIMAVEFLPCPIYYKLVGEVRCGRLHHFFYEPFRKLTNKFINIPIITPAHY